MAVSPICFIAAAPFTAGTIFVAVQRRDCREPGAYRFSDGPDPPHESERGHHHARGAETALQTVVLFERACIGCARRSRSRRFVVMT